MAITVLEMLQILLSMKTLLVPQIITVMEMLHYPHHNVYKNPKKHYITRFLKLSIVANCQLAVIPVIPCCSLIINLKFNDTYLLLSTMSDAIDLFDPEGFILNDLRPSNVTFRSRKTKRVKPFFSKVSQTG